MLKEAGKWVFGAVIGLVVLTLVAVGTGLLDIGLLKTLGLAKADAQREVYTNTLAYTQGNEEQLAKLFYEYNMEDTAVKKKIILDGVRKQFGNFDPDKIEDAELAKFLRDVKAGRLN